MSVVTIPKWSAHNVQNWDALWVSLPDGDKELNAASAALINYLCAIGVPKLTDDTAPDAWCRIAIHQALFGSFISDSSTKRPLFLTRKDVLRHIGLEIEGNSKTFGEFCEEIHFRACQVDEEELPSRMSNGGKSLLRYLGLSKDG